MNKEIFKPDSHTFDIIAKICRKHEMTAFMSPGRDHIFVKGKVPNQYFVDTKTESKEFPGYPLICINTNIDKLETGHGISGIDDLRDEIMTALDKAKPNVPAIQKEEVKIPEIKAPIRVPVCSVKGCGIEVPHARALDQVTSGLKVICESCEERQKEKEALTPSKINPSIPEAPKAKAEQKEKVMSGELIPTKPGVNLPAQKSDQEIDDMIETAKAQKALQKQGGMYSVSGKTRPDSAMVQGFANSNDISTEILFAEQTKDYAHVVVRGHRGNKYVDDVVHHDFETEFQLQTMEIINKNPEILDHYEGLIPVIKEGAKIEVGKKMVDAKYHLIHTLLAFKTFSIRDATTKAMNRVQTKLLNQDARSPEEVASEKKERDLVEELQNRKK